MLATACLQPGISNADDLDTSERASFAVRLCLDQTVDTDDKGKLSAAIKACTIVLEYKSLASAQRADALIHRGVAHRNANSLDKSLSDLLEAKSLTPTNAHASRMLAWTYRTMHRNSEAENEYDRALRLEPHSQAYLSRCVVRIDLKLYEKAISDCEIAYRMNVNEDSVFFTGWLYARLGRQADAMHILEPAIGGPMKSGRIYSELAEIYGTVGRDSDAKRLREQAHKLFPNDPSLTLPPARQ
jgi:tetratricopeptide (TPR) repeat protein